MSPPESGGWNGHLGQRDQVAGWSKGRSPSHRSSCSMDRRPGEPCRHAYYNPELSEVKLLEHDRLALPRTRSSVRHALDGYERLPFAHIILEAIGSCALPLWCVEHDHAAPARRIAEALFDVLQRSQLTDRDRRHAPSEAQEDGRGGDEPPGAPAKPPRWTLGAAAALDIRAHGLWDERGHHTSAFLMIHR
jgi:hypothetical protein